MTHDPTPKDEATHQGATSNLELKAAFDREVDAVESLMEEHNLAEEFTPIWDNIHQTNIIYAAPAIAIARLLSGYRVDTVERIFRYALYNLKFNTRVNDIKIELPASKDEQSSDIPSLSDS